MKKIYKLFIILFLVGIFQESLQAYSFKKDGLFYNIISSSDRTCEVTLDDNTGTFYTLENIIIPEQVSYNGYKYSVISIGNDTFAGCQNIVSISLPATIKYIGDNAFYWTSITSIQIPSSVVSIGAGAFTNCSKLNSVNINNINAWCEIDFANEFSNPLIFAENLYLNNDLVTNIENLEGLREIKSYAFRNYNKLEQITLPSTVEKIGAHAFQYCKNLSSINIPSSVKFIGEDAFSEYAGSALNAVYIDDLEAWCNIEFSSGFSNPVTFANNLYLNNVLLTDVIIPESITEIKDKTFTGATNIKSVILPISISRIGESAFGSCINLSDINIPDNISYIGSYAFSNCKSLSHIDFSPNMNSIEAGTFNSCHSLTSVFIPQNITSLGDDSFSQCSRLKEVCVQSYSPQTINYNVFQNINSDCVLYVPTESVTLYENAEYWKYFKTIKGFDYVVNIYNGQSTDEMKFLTSLEIDEYNLANNSMLIVNGLYSTNKNNIISNASNAYHASSISLTDALPFYCPEDVEVEEITYTRTFKNHNWQALYLPFSLSFDEWDDNLEIAYFNNIHQYDNDNDGIPEVTKIEYFTQRNGDLKPNVPYIVKLKDEISTPVDVTLTGTNKILTKTPDEDGYVDCMSTRYYYKIAGFYQTKTDLFEKDQMTLSGGGFKLANSSLTIPPFRIYLDVEDRNTSSTNPSPMMKTRSIEITVDGEDVGTTDIEFVTTDNADGIYYDLRGNRIGTPVESGYYIRNGRIIYLSKQY